MQNSCYEQSTEPQTLYNVFGLKRGGHHAVINGILAACEATGRTTAHVNNVYQQHLGLPERAAEDPSCEQVLLAGEGKDVLLVSYEDVHYSTRGLLLPYAELQVRASAKEQSDVVIVRDYYNNLASRLQRVGEARRKRFVTTMDAIGWQSVREVWKDLAAVLAAPEAYDGTIGINYNQWVADQRYRDGLADKNLCTSDGAIDSVPATGQGSSFDGLSYDGKAKDMNVLRRWQDLSPDLIPEYQGLISADPEIVELNRDLFGIDYSDVMQDTTNRHDQLRALDDINRPDNSELLSMFVNKIPKTYL